MSRVMQQTSAERANRVESESPLISAAKLRYCRLVKRAIALLIAAAALFGLLAAEAAFAGAPPAQMVGQTSAATAMSDDCADMMAATPGQKGQGEPCKGMTPDCIAKMGCAISSAVIPTFGVDIQPGFNVLAPLSIQTAQLNGRATTPEPPPPNFPG